MLFLIALSLGCRQRSLAGRCRAILVRLAWYAFGEGCRRVCLLCIRSDSAAGHGIFILVIGWQCPRMARSWNRGKAEMMVVAGVESCPRKLQVHLQGLRRSMHASGTTHAEICGAVCQAWKGRFFSAKIRAEGTMAILANPLWARQTALPTRTRQLYRQTRACQRLGKSQSTSVKTSAKYCLKSHFHVNIF